MISIEKIVKGKNPRKHIERKKLEELAISIKEQGLIQPIIVEPHEDGTFILVAGERRLEAHKLLKRRNIRAEIRERTNHDGRERFLAAIVENDQREDMNPMDRAEAYLLLHDVYHMSSRDIGWKIGKVQAVVDNYLLLNRLDKEIQELIREGFWKDPRVARGLLQIANPKTRIALAERLFEKRISLSGSLIAIKKTMAALEPVQRKYSWAPALTFAEAECKPLKWDSLRQLGRVPAWELVVTSAESTCQACPLRDVASPLNCKGCAAVTLLQRLVEITQ
jgi:ParB family chromosome partitioning protein